MKSITLPLHELLDYMWGYRSLSNANIQLAEQIKALDPLEELCHVELASDTEHPPGENKAEGPPNPRLGIVWKKKDWDTSIHKWRLEKSESERVRVESFRRMELIDRLVVGIKSKFGLDKDLAINMANTIYISNNVELAKQFGVSEIELRTNREQIPRKV